MQSYINSIDEWDMNRLVHHIPPQLLNKIRSVVPPHDDFGPDKFAWALSNDGAFSIKSAYQYLVENNTNNVDQVWKRLGNGTVRGGLKLSQLKMSGSLVNSCAGMAYILE